MTLDAFLDSTAVDKLESCKQADDLTTDEFDIAHTYLVKWLYRMFGKFVEKNAPDLIGRFVLEVAQIPGSEWESMCEDAAELGYESDRWKDN